MIIDERSKERNELLLKIEEQNNLLVSQISQEEDDVDIFFKSIAMTVKKITKTSYKRSKNPNTDIGTSVGNKLLGYT